MAHYQTLVSLLVVVIMYPLMDECRTPADDHSEGRRHSSLRGINIPCLRPCLWDTRHQQKRKTNSFYECIKQCEESKAPRVSLEGENPRVSVRLRRKRRAEAGTVQTCHGVSTYTKNVGWPVPTKILHVDFQANYHYNVSWKPFDENTIKEHNWTHYSLFYTFLRDDVDPGPGLECVLIPKNRTHWLLEYKPPRYSSTQPTNLLSTVVTYPFSRDLAVGIELQSFSAIDPASLPTFSPYFSITKAPKFDLAIPIASGSSALLVILLIAIYVWRRRVSRPHEVPVRHRAITRANNSTANAATDNLPSNQENGNESYYSCYYPESEAFRQQVAAIVNKFRANGYNVIMDAMVSHEISSLGPTKWAEVQIRKAKKVLVFLSPGLLKLSLGYEDMPRSEDANRVWCELEVLRSIYNRSRSAAKTVCLELPDMPVSSMEHPVFFKVIYKWPNDFEKILRGLNDRPSILPK
ncbi:unnamed protein product [Porites lobata]|uniref:SEFIR domain-containing protein n=1 Tax=Porites lobata TaxID=104759 RepID=A0ABN8Q3U0_9CNID|nr:unnamed protein product [Porites lobata]